MRAPGEAAVTAILYDKDECPFCWKVRLAMHAQARPFTRRPHDHPDSVSELGRLSVTGKVPVLVDGELVIPESSVITEYLEETGGGLLPRHRAGRVKARLLAYYSDNTVGKAVREVIFAKRGRPPEQWDRGRIDAGIAAWLELLPYLSAELGEQRYFAGDYSLADCALGARFGLAMAYGVPLPETYPRLHRWYERVAQRPGFRETAPRLVTSPA